MCHYCLNCFFLRSGPSCSKLTMSLVNDSLKFTSSDMQICWFFFCWKNVSSFCTAKATHIFSAKNIRILYIESAKTVSEMTLNELVKLTMLWTTGPWELTFTTLSANSAEKLIIFFLFLFDMSCKMSPGGKNKNISICCLLKKFPRVLRVEW